MRRRSFLVAAAALLPLRVRAQSASVFDPALTSRRPALRVLLGSGSVAAAPVGFLFNGRPYRGRAEQLPDGRIVDRVDLESYLYSVVPREMGTGWPAAALAAQAICARTYVLRRSNPRRGYDLVPSEADQVYAGMLGETPDGRAAVDATAGMVLTYGDGFASVAYSSCCGGHTESSSAAWGAAPIAYLEGVVCPWCTASPEYAWTRELPLERVASAYAARLDPIGALQNVAITTLDRSGRARAFRLDASSGSTIVPGNAFRLRVGPRAIPSLLITSLTQAAGTIGIEGRGLGHGVGLCQWGARGMAMAGKAFGEILTWYFPGTALGHD